MFCLKIKQLHLRKIIAPLFAWLALTGCGPKEAGHRLYPIDSLISAQAKTLAKLNAVLHKQAFMGSKTDSSIYSPKDSLAWNSELDIFRQLEVINKPVSQASYLIDDNLYDPGSNLTVKAFTSTRKELPVQYMRVYYDRSPVRPRKIEAQYAEFSALYKSYRLLELEFQQINNKTVLTSYTVRTGQKMVLADSVAFFLKGKIVID